MSLFDKLRSGNSQKSPRPALACAGGRVATGGSAPPVKAMKTGPGTNPSIVPRALRLSNGLKEFLCQLDGIGRGHLLDLGPARQTTITFFIERGFKVYTEDLLATWKLFLDAEEKQWRERPPGPAAAEVTPAPLPDPFLETPPPHPA